MTTRDMEIIDFVYENKIVTTTTLNHFFFNSIHSCYKVLHRLAQQGHLKRMKVVEGNQNSEYAYYIKKPPAQLKHYLCIMEFYTKWDKKEKILEFETQKELGSIIPDAVIRCDNNVYLLEVELSNKGFNYLKYEKFYSSGEYLKYYKTMPVVLVYGKAKIPSNTRVKFRVFAREF